MSDETVLKEGDEISIICMVQGVKLYNTKNDSKMLFVKLEDMTGEIEAIVFPDLYRVSGKLFIKGSIIFIKSKISYKDDEPKLLAESVLTPAQFINVTGNMNIYIKCRSDDADTIKNILNIASEDKYRGEMTLMFYFYDLKKKVLPKNINKVNISAEFLTKITGLIGTDNVVVSK